VTSANQASPLDARRRNRGPECASRLTLDRLALGELPEAERTTLAAHLSTCADCARAGEALAADRSQFLAEAALPTLAADALARAERARVPMWERLRRLVMPLALGAAGVAGLALWLRPDDGHRTKGEFSLSPYVLHTEGGPGTLHVGEPLHPGDQLQFRYNGAKAGYLAVVAVDARGKVSIYYPPGPRAAQVPAGREVPLSSAVELDGTLGRETVVGVRCQTPVGVDEILAATRKAARGGELGPLGLPCEETRYQFDKSARP
jgi:anti-sigma factor RsiW